MTKDVETYPFLVWFSLDRKWLSYKLNEEKSFYENRDNPLFGFSKQKISRYAGTNNLHLFQTEEEMDAFLAERYYMNKSVANKFVYDSDESSLICSNCDKQYPIKNFNVESEVLDNLQFDGQNENAQHQVTHQCFCGHLLKMNVRIQLRYEQL